MIKNIVFDLGNVLVDFDPPRFVMEKTADKNQQKMLMSEIFGSVDWLRFDKGTMNREELLTSAKSRLPKELHAIAEDLLDTWYIGLNAIPQMEELPKRLKEKGLSLYILSNAPQDYYLYYDKSLVTVFLMASLFPQIGNYLSLSMKSSGPFTAISA